MSKQPPPAPTAIAVGPCPMVIQIVGRSGPGSLPRTIAPPDHPLTAQGHATKMYARGGAIFLQMFPLFLSLSLSSYFPFHCAFYLIFLFWPCLFYETSRVFEKRHGLSRFSEPCCSSFFFRHLKASGVLPVCV